MTYPIPAEAFDDRLAVTGTSGSGKTYSVLGALARLMKDRRRFIAADALGVMFGLRLKADGVTPSEFKPVIFGGPHGDLPLTVAAAPLLGEAAAGMAESVILDLSQLGTKAAERRFMLGFLKALEKHANREPVHLVFDEADLWAPQKIFDKEGEAMKLLGVMDNIVRRGRIKGFIPWLITQRPAVLSKDVLSQADGVVAMKLTGSQDRDAIGGWIEGQADRAKGKETLALLPTMSQGEGVIWIPGRQILKTAKFPPNATFDSSRTPKRGESIRRVDLKPLDLGKLKDRLATVEEEAKANDPAALKAQVAQLTATVAQLNRLGPPKGFKDAGPKVDAAALRDRERAHAAGRAEGLGTGWAAGYERGHRDGQAVGFDLCQKTALGVIKAWTGEQIAPPKPKPPKDLGAIATQAVHVVPPGPVLLSKGTKALIDARAAGPDYPTEAKLEGPLQKIVDAIRWCNLLGVAAPSQIQAGFVAGYSAKSGTWSTYLGRLRGAGMIEGRGDLTLTDQGNAAARDPANPPTGAALRAMVMSRLDGPLQKILAPVLEAHPNAISQAEVGAAANYSTASGTWSTYLGRLRGMDLISGRGDLEAADWLFPERAIRL